MFLTVEGVEGAGKSTVLQLLAEALQTRGLSVVRTREPGGCKLGQTLRPLLVQAGQSLCPPAELFLFQADRAQHVSEIIRPALAQGHCVLCDRYADSTIAYQGAGRGFSVDVLEYLHTLATENLWPDRTFLLDISPELGLARARARSTTCAVSQNEARFESETLAFHARIREGFLQRAVRYPQRFCVLDATLSPESLLALMLENMKTTGLLS